MRILIVNSNSICGTLLKEFLNPLGECVWVKTGAAALEIFSQSFFSGKRFDLVCMDNLMTDRDYKQLKWEFRKIELEESDPNCDEIKYVLTSSLIDLEKILEGFRMRKDVLEESCVCKHECSEHNKIYPDNFEDVNKMDIKFGKIKAA